MASHTESRSTVLLGPLLERSQVPRLSTTQPSLYCRYLLYLFFDFALLMGLILNFLPSQPRLHRPSCCTRYSMQLIFVCFGTMTNRHQHQHQHNNKDRHTNSIVDCLLKFKVRNWLSFVFRHPITLVLTYHIISCEAASAPTHSLRTSPLLCQQRTVCQSGCVIYTSTNTRTDRNTRTDCLVLLISSLHSKL